jgi:hypothetical protein
MRIGRVFLGGLAALVIATSAWAVDAVVDDQPRLPGPDDVSACDAYGTGFAKLPGTNTCVRVSGQMRFEEGFSTSSHATSRGRTTLDFETRSDP